MTVLLWLVILWIVGPLVVACIALVFEHHDIPVGMPQSPCNTERQRRARQAEHGAGETHTGRYRWG